MWEKVQGLWHGPQARPSEAGQVAGHRHCRADFCQPAFSGPLVSVGRCDRYWVRCSCGSHVLHHPDPQQIEPAGLQTVESAGPSPGMTPTRRRDTGCSPGLVLVVLREEWARYLDPVSSSPGTACRRRWEDASEWGPGRLRDLHGYWKPCRSSVRCP